MRYLNASKNWQDDEMDKVIENEKAKVIQVFRIQSDKHLPHNTANFKIVDKKDKTLDFGCEILRSMGAQNHHQSTAQGDFSILSQSTSLRMIRQVDEIPNAV